MSYLQNSALFAQFRWSCRRKIFENQVSKEDLPIAQSLVLLSPKNPDFEEEVSEQVAKFGEEPLKGLIAKVMGLADSIPKPSPSAVVSPRRFTVHPSISVLWPKPNPSDSKTIPYRRSTMDVAADLFSPLGLRTFPHTPFHLCHNSTIGRAGPTSPSSRSEATPASPSLIRVQTMTPSPPPFFSKETAEERGIPPVPPRPPRVASFIISNKDVSSPVSDPDENLSPKSEADDADETFPNLAKIAILRSGGKSFAMKIDAVGASGKDRKLHTKRALSDIQLQRKGDFAALLADRSSFEKIIEGAVCIRYLFPESFRKLFPHKEEQKVVKKIILVHSMRKISQGSTKKIIETLFSVKGKEESRRIDHVLTKILKDQTISKISAASSFPHERSLPNVFLKPPFDSRKSLYDFLEVATYVMFHCLARYSEYPENEKRILYCIIAAFTLSEIFPVDFPPALNRVLSLEGAVQESHVESLVLRVNLGLKARSEEQKEEAPFFDSQKSIEQILSSRHFADEPAFKALMAKISEKEFLPTDFYGKHFCRLLRMIQNRISNEPILWSDALKNSLTVNGLRRLYQSQSDLENIQQTVRVLKEL